MAMFDDHRTLPYPLPMKNLSILDLVFINQNSHPQVALHNSLRLAQRAEELGYTRFWVAEHHNSASIASAATSVVIGFLASGTKKIRIGAGGIMLPNHSPLVIAEQFGTLEALYPGRIDLGLGRAPGTDQKTLRALRRDPMTSQNFPQDVQELQYYFQDVAEKQPIQAVPGGGLHVPLWILGSSTFGAQLAAALGLPYAFASHFAPDSLGEAIHIYREAFRPSKQLKKPHLAVGVNVIAADTDKEAQFLFTSMQQSFANLHRDQRGQFPPPIKDIETYWSPQEKMMASHMLNYSVVGSPETVRKGLKEVYAQTNADELIVVGSIYDIEARIKSFELTYQAAAGL
jgi:luciferase family oxidoreductase group 1